MNAPAMPLPANVTTMLTQFVETAKSSFGADLVSIVLYGSGAEGKLGPKSDVNVLVVLREFVPEKAAGVHGAYLAAHAAIKLNAMFLLEDEVSAATEFFAQKFADIIRRHQVLYGKDVFSGIAIDREHKIFRLRQMLLNLALRQRSSYVTRAQQPEQIAHLLADLAGPLRAAATTLLELEGHPATDPGAALVSVGESVSPSAAACARNILSAHQGATVERPSETLLQAIEFIRQIAARADRLQERPRT